MAKRVETYLVDDLTGERDDSVKERLIMLDSRRIVVDLSDDSYARLEEKLAPYVAASRGRRGTASNPRNLRTATGAKALAEPTTAEIRAWAKRRRIKVADRGRIPADLRQQYLATYGKAA
ncbi:Lsr2 dimerization domain-containing protein [Streptomyces sp. L500]